jgi:hypothetical protein
LSQANASRGNKTTRALRDARRARAWSYADDVIELLGLGQPHELDVEAIARGLDAEVIDAELPGAEAQLVVRDRQRRPLDLRARIRVARDANPVRRRFSIAHELGHLVMRHAPRALGELCTSDAMEGRTTRPEEEEANAFAAALLLPAQMIGTWARDPYCTLTAAREIARTFDVAIGTAAIRLIELTPHAWALVTCRGGRVVRVSRSAAFPTYIEQDWTPGPDSVVVEHAAWKRRLPERERVVPAHTWIADEAHHRVTLIEQATILPGTSDVLVMLRIEPRDVIPK